ncbi:hypothetical protein ACHAWO_002569 [Cyclotella atomus]|uniref:Uncharacterized protein n=1 Tax=Cyclotella atomus TaxID=382360 RepID=A0ABD3PZP0_9STRA
MNTSLTTFVFASVVISSTAMTSLYSESRLSVRQIDLPSPFDGNDQDFQLPAELKSLISSVSAENAESESRYAKAGVKYYASYSVNKMCASKSASSFESWEEAFDSLEDCCEVAYSWDVNSCLGN